MEDAVLVIYAKLQREGYLYPQITANIVTEEGEAHQFTWVEPLREPLPRKLKAKRLAFEIHPGVLFYYDNILFGGLNALKVEEAAHFFIETDALIKMKRNRIYSPERLRSGTQPGGITRKARV